jgi:hypothetical protein
MKLEHIKSYKKLLDKIRSNTYNIKKEDYQHFQELTKSNTIYSFFHFSNLLFQDKEEVGIVKKLWEPNKISYKKFKQIRLANFYQDLYFSLTPFYSTFMQYKADEALQIAYHTKGSYQEKARAAFDYLDK